MSTIFTLLMVLIVIASLLMVIVVMAQNPKGGGLSSTFGSTSSSQFGVQRTNDFMENATWTLGIVIGALCLLSVILTAEPITNTSVPVQTTSKTATKEVKKEAEKSEDTTSTTTTPVKEEATPEKK